MDNKSSNSKNDSKKSSVEYKTGDVPTSIIGKKIYICLSGNEINNITFQDVLLFNQVNITNHTYIVIKPIAAY